VHAHLITASPGLVPAIALGLIAIEWLVGRLRGIAVYDARQTAVTLAIFVGGRIVGAATAGIAAIPAALLYRHRLLDIPMTSPAALAALFLAVELCYYWHHRAMHAVNWLWATHAVHHSTTKLNLSAALRLGWAAR